MVPESLTEHAVISAVWPRILPTASRMAVETAQSVPSLDPHTHTLPSRLKLTVMTRRVKSAFSTSSDPSGRHNATDPSAPPVAAI